MFYWFGIGDVKIKRYIIIGKKFFKEDIVFDEDYLLGEVLVFDFVDIE